MIAVEEKNKAVGEKETRKEIGRIGQAYQELRAMASQLKANAVESRRMALVCTETLLAVPDIIDEDLIGSLKDAQEYLQEEVS